MASITAVNDELGTRQPVAEIFSQLKLTHPHLVTMTDFVQGLGKIKL